MMKKIIIICLLSISLFAKFIKDDVSIIVDTQTLLMWEANSDVKEASWEEAVKYCEELEYGGYGKGYWRLPSAIELYSLVDITKANPAIDSTFEDIKYGYFENYWTRSVNNNGYAVTINFALGTTNYNYVTSESYKSFNVMCVMNF
jgi:hypothetical protein